MPIKKHSFRQNQSESCAFSMAHFYFGIKLHKKTPIKQKTPILLHKRKLRYHTGIREKKLLAAICAATMFSMDIT